MIFSFSYLRSCLVTKKMQRISVSLLKTYLFIQILPTIFLQTTIHPSQVDLIDQTCKRTPYYDLCLSSLKSNTKSAESDSKGLAVIIAELLLANASNTLGFIESMINKTKDQDVERNLAFCAELYIPIVKYNLPQAIDALREDRFLFAEDGIADAGKEADTCEKKFSGGSENSALSDRNEVLHKLSDVALAIVDILLEG